jgi:hypothetical protein
MSQRESGISRNGYDSPSPEGIVNAIHKEAHRRVVEG